MELMDYFLIYGVCQYPIFINPFIYCYLPYLSNCKKLYLL